MINYVRTLRGILLTDWNVELSRNAKDQIVYTCRATRDTKPIQAYLHEHQDELLALLQEGAPCNYPLCWSKSPAHQDWWWHRDGGFVCRFCHPPTIPGIEIPAPIPLPARFSKK